MRFVTSEILLESKGKDFELIFSCMSVSFYQFYMKLLFSFLSSFAYFNFSFSISMRACLSLSLSLSRSSISNLIFFLL